MKDITSKEDIVLLVNAFYDRVLADDVLGPFFKHVNFEKHKPKMIHFWSFVLLDEPGYTTNITEVHQHLHANMQDYMHWNTLFSETVNALSAKINLEILAAGIYTLKVENESGVSVNKIQKVD